ncbi:sensor domain-containing protein [Nocardia altamirensis]|uniref:sensor domain-containing protein n=1 Tax=Nocardia altamirensis TaxID=472158 RepID=UPI00083FFBA6|nr:sensor domain-containing protein [Nocardia altamirensis]
MSWVRLWLRAAGYAVWALPLAMSPVATRLRVPRRTFGESVTPRDRLAWRAMLHSVLSAAVGLLAMFFVLLAVLGAVRGVAYPLVAGDNYENSWGGPTLAGAWAVHAVLGLGVLPLWFAALAGLGALQIRLVRGTLGRVGPRWPVLVAVLLIAGGVLLFVCWLHLV